MLAQLKKKKKKKEKIQSIKTQYQYYSRNHRFAGRQFCRQAIFVCVCAEDKKSAGKNVDLE